MTTFGSLHSSSVQLVLERLLHDHFLTLSELAERTGLSRSNVVKIVAELEAEQVVIAGEPERSQAPVRGRPPAPRCLHPGFGVALGIGIARDQIIGVLTDPSLRLIARVQCDVVDGAADELMPLVIELGAELADDPPAPLLGVGVALPRLMQADIDALSEQLQAAVYVANDADSEALAEQALGAARGMSTFLYIKAGTRLDGATVVDGAPRSGAAGRAGALAHIPMRAGTQGRPVQLGDYVSGDALLQAFRPSYGENLTLEGLLALARAGDANAIREIVGAGRDIGGALASACTMLNPDGIVVGDTLAAHDSPLLTGIREGLRQGALPAATEHAVVKPAQLGADSSAIGAARQVLRSPTVRARVMAR